MFFFGLLGSFLTGSMKNLGSDFDDLPGFLEAEWGEKEELFALKLSFRLGLFCVMIVKSRSGHSHSSVFPSMW